MNPYNFELYRFKVSRFLRHSVVTLHLTEKYVSGFLTEVMISQSLLLLLQHGSEV